MTAQTASFIWYELMTTDANAAAEFYAQVIGWQIPREPMGPPGGMDYRPIGRSDGGSAGGVLQLTADMVAHGARPTWVGYLYVPNVDAAAKAMEADGARVLMPKKTLPVGDIVMMADPMGAPFYVMRPVPPPGQPDKQSDVFHPTQAQHIRWNELQTSDLPQALRFYAKHFGFSLDESMPMGALGNYHFIHHGGLTIGGMMAKPAPEAPGGWQFYFGVPSVLAAERAIKAAGGKVVVDLHQVPGGDWVLNAVDPQGAPFSVVGPKGE